MKAWHRNENVCFVCYIADGGSVPDAVFDALCAVHFHIIAVFWVDAVLLLS